MVQNGTEWLTVKTSLIKDAGYGLFADRKFEVGDIVSVYLGFASSIVIQEIVHTKFDDSEYKIQIPLPETNEMIVLNVDDGGFPQNKVMYLGAQMFNDPMLNAPEGEIDENAFNVKIFHNLTLVSEKVINIGDEILGSYDFDK